MVVTEALARGLPVIAADVGGRDGGPRSRRRRDPAGAAGRAGGPRGTRRRAPGLARRRRAESAAAPGRPRAARVAPRVVDHRVGRSPASWPGRRDELPRPSGSAADGLPSASPPTPRPARATSSTHVARRLPATGRRVIHDLGCGTGAMGRWLAPLLPGPQHWVLHDRDADLLEARRRRRSPARPPTGPRSPSRRRHSDITRLEPGDLAGASLITASALLDMLTEDELAGLVARLRRRGMPGAADPVGRRSRRADPGGSTGPPRGRRIRCPPAPRDRAGPPARPGRRRVRRRGVRPAGRRGPRPAQPLATRRLGRRPGGGVVHRVGGCRVRAAAPSWPPRPTPTRAGVWRRQRPGSSRSPWTTPTCWSCRDHRVSPR